MDRHHKNNLSHFEDLEDQSDFDLFDQENDFDLLENYDPQVDDYQSISIDKTVSHVQVIVEGIEVLFPYEPYEPQIAYMASVIKALNKGENRLLQSPTGTGKTLCLLCATLAWMHHNKSRSQIFYSSRTHSQLKQVVEQLKETCYRPVTTMLASRNYSCVKYKDELKGPQLIDACRTGRYPKSDEEGCKYYEGLQFGQNKFLQKYSKKLCDIEDLFKEGKEQVFCPYYLQRKILAHANIVFVPYIYLINPYLRSQMEINLTGKIIIFDEAHNIEKQIEEANSYEFPLISLYKCKVYFGKLDELIEDNPDDKQLLDLEIRLLEKPIHNFLEALVARKKNLERNLKGILPHRNSASKERRYEIFQNNKLEVLDGSEIFQLFKNEMKDDDNSKETTFKNGVDHTNFQDFIEILAKAYEPEDKKIQRKDFSTLSRLSKKVFEFLKMEISAIKNNTQFDYSQNFIKSYKLCFSLETGEKFRGDIDHLPETFDEDFFDLKIKLVCLNPGIGFTSLSGEKPLSFLLSSGTLAPFESFESELMTTFPEKLNNEHVINKKIIQCKAFVVSQGPSQVTLDFSYKNKKDQNIVEELGYSIISIAQKIPNGILLCFSSYSLRDRCLSEWRKLTFENTNLSIYDKLNSIKPIHLETRDAVSLRREIELYTQKAKTNKGASMFCVCRGKVSEGIDFAGEMARAVFLVGIPLPPAKDLLINAKERFLDDKNRRNPKSLTGKKWYNQEATRAFNQAIGRVIRHKDDYGLVFFCDRRYGEAAYFEHISSWVKPHTEKYLNFYQIMNQIEPFYNECAKNFPPKTQQNSVPQNSVAENKKNHKRPGIEPARDKSELKKVMQTPKKVIHNKTNEFGIPSNQILNPLLTNQNIPAFHNQVSNNAMSFFSEFPSSQERMNPNIMDPHLMMSLENTCDSSDPRCESCAVQRPLKNFTSPSKEGKPVCDKCWKVCEEYFEGGTI